MRSVPSMKTAKVVDFLKERIVLTGEVVDEGRDGVVLSGKFKHGPQFDVAVKFYIPMEDASLFSAPSRLPAFANALQERYDHELAALGVTPHPNVQQYVSCGVFEYDKEYFRDRCKSLRVADKIPFIVTRLVYGTRLDRLLKKPPTLSRSQVVAYLCGIARGLAHLHSKGILHGDVRSANVIVEEPSLTPILLDFGLAKDFASDDNALTSLFIDPKPLPKIISRALASIQDEQRRWPSKALKAILFPFLDLFCFGSLLEELLTSPAATVLHFFDQDYLALIVEDLKLWKVKRGECPPTCEMGGAIRTTGDLVGKFERLVAGPDYFRRELEVREAAPSRTIIRQSGSVEIRQSVAPFLSHPSLRRLHNINQLALVRYVYPSAGQSRFDHVLSTLARVQQMWRALAKRPAFLFHMEWKDIDRLELAALHHDVNHFPFLHYFQEAGIEAVNRTKVLDLFVKPLEAVANGTGMAERCPSSLSALLLERGIELEYLRKLLSPSGGCSGTSVADQIITSIINSGVDADKPAYLPDDALFSGLPFGKGIDLHGILDGIDVAKIPLLADNKTWHIVFSYEALPAVESVCFARYWNFQRLYWHHTNRAIAAMIIWTVRELYSHGRASPDKYLRATQDLGEAGALEYLALAYQQMYRREAPIEGLGTNRDRVYKRVFEMAFSGGELEKALDKFHDIEAAPLNRDEAQQRVSSVIQDFLQAAGAPINIEPGEVLLDIPLRKMDLGGVIFIRKKDGSIEPATKVSHVLRELEQNFSLMSKVLRIYVAPHIRNSVGTRCWESASALRSAIVSTLQAERPSEVR